MVTIKSTYLGTTIVTLPGDKILENYPATLERPNSGSCKIELDTNSGSCKIELDNEMILHLANEIRETFKQYG